MIGIEYAFNKFPSTELSSGILVASLFAIEFCALFISQDCPASQKSRHVSEQRNIAVEEEKSSSSKGRRSSSGATDKKKKK